MTTLHITNSINRSPLRLAFLLIAVPLACLVMTPAARAETATAVGNCRSIVLDPATGYLPGLGQLRTYVSTYDGQPGFPLYQPLPDGSISFSGELQSDNAQTGLYKADFATYDSVDSLQDYGSFTLTLPITDSDQNGLPDVVQRDKPGNAQGYGSVVSDFYGTFSSITGTLSRSANSIAGTYFVNVTTGSTTISYSGSLYLFNVSGTCTYSRNAGTISFALNETLAQGGNQTLSGLTTFEVVDANRITLRQFNVNASDGSTYSALATTLTRSGKKYRGNLQLADGNPQTYWRDYTSWVFEILDQNDSNHDGIPNLSDPTGPPPPPVTGPPVAITNPATLIASFSTTLNGSVDPNGLTTSVYFQYGTTTGYGFTTAPQTKTGNTSQSVSAHIGGLTASTTYHFRIVTSNSAGTRYGSDRTFTTLPPTGFPMVTTKPATNVATFAATLNGLLDPHGLTTTVYFQYGRTTSYGNRTPNQTKTGNNYQNVSANISGLSGHTTYHFRIVATNSVGTRYSNDSTFTTQ
jgi:hypothetical protein